MATLDKRLFLGRASGRERHEHWRDIDLPIAWLFRVISTLAMCVVAVIAWVSNDKLSTLKDVADKMPWVIGTIAGIQQELTQQNQQITQIYQSLLDERRKGDR